MKEKNSFPNKATQFSTENQPEKNGRPKGVLNTKTILNRFLNSELEQMNPFTKELEKMSVQELMSLVQIKKALEGDLQAFKEITDRYEGPVSKIIESTGTMQIKEFDITKLYDAENSQTKVEPTRSKK